MPSAGQGHSLTPYLHSNVAGGSGYAISRQPLQATVDSLVLSIDSGQESSRVIEGCKVVMQYLRGNNPPDLQDILPLILRLCDESSSVELRCAGLEVVIGFLGKGPAASTVSSIDRATIWSVLKDMGSTPGESVAEWKLKCAAITSITDGGNDIDGIRGLVHATALWTKSAQTLELNMKEEVLTWCSDFMVSALSRSAERLTDADVDEVVMTFDDLVRDALSEQATLVTSPEGGETSQTQAEPISVEEAAPRRRYPWLTLRQPSSPVQASPSSYFDSTPAKPPSYDLPCRLYLHLVNAGQTISSLRGPAVERIIQTLLLIIYQEMDSLPPIRLQHLSASASTTTWGLTFKDSIPPRGARTRPLQQEVLDSLWRLLQNRTYSDVTIITLQDVLCGRSSTSVEPKQVIASARVLRLAMRRGAIQRLARLWLNEASSYAPTGSPTFLDSSLDADEVLQIAWSEGIAGVLWEMEQAVEVLPQAIQTWAKRLQNASENEEAQRVVGECLGFIDDILEEARQVADGNTMALGVFEGRIVGEVLAEVIRCTETTVFDEQPLLHLRPRPNGYTSILLQRLNDVFSGLLLASCLEQAQATPSRSTKSLFVALPSTISPSVPSTLLSAPCYLDDELLVELILYHRDNGFLNPTASAWLDSWHRLTEAVKRVTPVMLPAAPLNAKKLLLEAMVNTYGDMQDYPQYRTNLLLCIVPTCERWLVEDDTPEIYRVICTMLASATSTTSGVEDPDNDGGDESTANRIKLILVRTASAPCSSPKGVISPVDFSPSSVRPTPATSPSPIVPAPSPPLKRPIPTPSRSLFPSGLQRLVNRSSRSNLSATMPNPASPTIPAFGVTSPAMDAIPQESLESAVSSSMRRGSPHQCKSVAGAFALVQALQETMACGPSHISRGVSLFRAIIRIVSDGPRRSKNGSYTSDAGQSCRHARLVVLRWLLSLRSDQSGGLKVTLDSEFDLDLYASLVGKSNAPVESRGRDSGATSSPRRREFSPAPRGDMETTWSLPDAVPLPPEELQRWSSASFTGAKAADIPIPEYVEALILVLQHETDWEILSFVLCLLPLQLANKYLFSTPGSLQAIMKLTEVLLKSSEGLSRVLKTENYAGALALVFHSLTSLLCYKEYFSRSTSERLVESFRAGVNKYPTTIKPCLRGLTLCAFELPGHFSRALSNIISQLTLIVTNPAASIHILELVIILGTIPEMYSNFREDDYKRIFTVASRYIQHHHRVQRSNVPSGSQISSPALSEHVLALAYYTIYVWVLALRRVDRPKYVAHIVRSLEEISTGSGASVHIDQRTEVCFDWLARYSSGEMDPRLVASFLGDVVLGGPTQNGRTWLRGNALLTCRPLPPRDAEILELECRRPSGMTRFPCKLDELSQVTGIASKDLEEVIGSVHSTGHVAAVAPDTVDVARLSLEVSSQLGSIGLGESFLAQDTEELKRALRTLDRTPVVDSHTIAILYVGPGQTTEQEVLSNRGGSPAYTRFLEGLGRLVRLKNQRDIYPGSLDTQNDMDGQFAYAWSSDIIQVLYHTTTLMPNQPGDVNFNLKKRHVGNDYIRIIWNDSGSPYKFDTLKTEFQFVNVVIEPHFMATSAETDRPSAEIFRVFCQRAADMPEFGPIGLFKLVTADNLSTYVRHASLLADFFVPVWVHTQRDTKRVEYVTNWRRRLQTIKRVRENVLANTPTA